MAGAAGAPQTPSDMAATRFLIVGRISGASDAAAAPSHRSTVSTAAHPARVPPATIEAMSTRLWDHAARLPAPVDGRRRAEVAVLSSGLPDVPLLFTFMRDAEMRFETLRIRIEDTVAASTGELVSVMEATLRHPGHARVTTTDPALGVTGSYEVWVSDGDTVRTYSAAHRLGTERPVRRSVVGLDDPDLPGMSTVYRPVTPLPMETLPDTFVHPGGYSQNVLATGRCWISGSADVAGREAIVLECDHPRTIEIAGDSGDHHLQLSVDRETGVILRLRETIGGAVTRDAIVTSITPDAPLQPGVFEFDFPTGTTMLY
jgi:outer membrane lipoprotein-sorting protein